MEPNEKKTFREKMKEESMYYLFSCLSSDEYTVTDDGIVIFYYRYVTHKVLHGIVDIAALFFVAVALVFLFSTLIELGISKPILWLSEIGCLAAIRRTASLRSLEYSISVGRLVARTIEAFPDYYIPIEPKEEEENGRTE